MALAFRVQGYGMHVNGPYLKLYFQIAHHYKHFLNVFNLIILQTTLYKQPSLIQPGLS